MIKNLCYTLFFLLGVVIIGILPVSVIYGFSSLIGFVLFRIIGYRKDVVRKNLEGSFPGISENELKRITQLFYKNLADVFVEGIWAFTMSKKQVYRRHRIINPEILEPFALTNQSLIAVTSHYTNWEWGTLSANAVPGYNIVAFYKRINNKLIDKLVRLNRSKFGTTLASINETSITFEKLKDKKTIFLMASDQGMPKKFAEKAYWVHFLNRNTPFLHGMEKHARLNNLPVVYIDIQRVRRGYYTIELSVLTAKPLELKEGFLTEMYARKLESIILKKPADWLWSHRRWKSIS
jgi:Kdo2-lipid IVA lauroyltransferase/acyltransferase